MWYQQPLAALDHAIFDIKNTTPSINLIRILMEMLNLLDPDAHFSAHCHADFVA